MEYDRVPPTRRDTRSSIFIFLNFLPPSSLGNSPTSLLHIFCSVCPASRFRTHESTVRSQLPQAPAVCKLLEGKEEIEI